MASRLLPFALPAVVWTSASTQQRRSWGPAVTWLWLRERFGREDLAITSFRVGIGNLETALDPSADDENNPIKEVVEREHPRYARLFFDSTPLVALGRLRPPGQARR